MMLPQWGPGRTRAARFLDGGSQLRAVTAIPSWGPCSLVTPDSSCELASAIAKKKQVIYCSLTAA